MSNIHEVDVVIIGAGLSGLTAALELSKTNTSFIVLEARNRPGGRIDSITNEGLTIDLGAQWISPKHHRVKRLLSQFRLHTISTYRKGKTAYHLSGKISYQKIPPISSLGLLDIYQFTGKLNKVSSKLLAHAPWKSPIAKYYDKITMEQFLQKNMYTTSGKNYFTLLLEEMICGKLFEVSALDVLWCVKTCGSVQNIRKSEQFWIQEGAGALVGAISEALEGKVRYDCPIEMIKYEENYAFLHTRKERWKARRVIIAIPPNLQTRIHFQPQLPATKVQLNERSGLPSVMKMIFVYETPFWRKYGLNGMIYSAHSPVMQTFDSSPKDGKVGVLTILTNGAKARDLEKLCQDERNKQIQATLVCFLGEEAAKPLEIHEKNWSEEEWTRGGYGVHYAPGVITNYGSALVESVSSLHWAGSETASEWRLFMEGAIQSGERAAGEVLKALQ